MVALLKRDVPRVMASNIALAALGVVSGILTARALQPSGRGELAAAILWPGLLVSLAGVGLPQAVVYYAGRERQAPGAVAGTSLILGLALGLPLAALAWWLVLPLALQTQRPEVLAAARLNLVFASLTLGTTLQLGILQGQGRLAAWSNLRLAQTLLYVLGLVVLVGLRITSVWNIVWILSVTSLLPGLVALWLLWHECAGAFHFDGALARRLMGYGLQNALAGAADVVNQRLDQAVLTLFVLPRELGLYVVAVALAQSLLPIATSFANVAFPRVVHSASAADAQLVIRRLFQAHLFVSIAVAVPLVAAAPVLLEVLFGAAYDGAASAARILLVAAVFYGVIYVLSDALRGLNAPIIPAVAEGIGLVTTVIGLYIALPRLGILGAALTTLFSYFTVALFLVWALQRRLDLSPAALIRPVPDDRRRIAGAWHSLRARATSKPSGEGLD